jgi:hypothetical protein
MEKLGGIFRAWPLWVWSVVFLIVVILLNPVQLGILFWGLLKLSTAAAGGYWIDRIIFPYARPGIYPETRQEWAWMGRRALIVAAAMLAMGANL